MRVNGRTKPRGAMKVKGSIPDRYAIVDAPVLAFVSIPKRGPLRRFGRGVSSSCCLPRGPYSGPRGRRATAAEPAMAVLSCSQGGADPGLAIGRRRAKLLLVSTDYLSGVA